MRRTMNPSAATARRSGVAHLLRGITISFAASLALPLPAGARPAPTLTAEQLTVRELMQLESELALEAARRRRDGKAVSDAAGKLVAASVTRSEAPRLVGIYGVGKRLFAEVRSGGRGYVFMRGHNLPLGHSARDDLYRLKALDGACARLERQGEETVLCLSRGMQ